MPSASLLMRALMSLVMKTTRLPVCHAALGAADDPVVGRVGGQAGAELLVFLEDDADATRRSA